VNRASSTFLHPCGQAPTLLHLVREEVAVEHLHLGRSRNANVEFAATVSPSEQPGDDDTKGLRVAGACPRPVATVHAGHASKT
jgi:hypothetical protein